MRALFRQHASIQSVLGHTPNKMRWSAISCDGDLCRSQSTRQTLFLGCRPFAELAGDVCYVKPMWIGLTRLLNHRLPSCRSCFERWRGSCSPERKEGYAIHMYSANTSMQDSSFSDADGDMLIVPEQGGTLNLSSLQSLQGTCVSQGTYDIAG